MEFVLVPGPMVRASSFEPTARHLRKLGYRTQVPDVTWSYDQGAIRLENIRINVHCRIVLHRPWWQKVVRPFGIDVLKG